MSIFCSNFVPDFIIYQYTNRMGSLKDSINDLLGQVQQMQANSAEELEALRIKYLSKKGEITSLFNEFRSVPNDQKRELGQLLNQLRQETESRINEMRERINDQMANDVIFDIMI